MLVVLSLAVRWVPDEEVGDPLGLGDPYNALRLDRTLLAYGPDTDRARALLRSITHPGSEQRAFETHWATLLRQLRRIKAEANEDTFVQFKGVVRNNMWPLMALLYPVRHSFASKEMGTEHDDPDLPGTTHDIHARMLAYSEMTQEQLAELQRKRGRAATPTPKPKLESEREDR